MEKKSITNQTGPYTCMQMSFAIDIILLTGGGLAAYGEPNFPPCWCSSTVVALCWRVVAA
jgi:hypothetical protein